MLASGAPALGREDTYERGNCTGAVKRAERAWMRCILGDIVSIGGEAMSSPLWWMTASSQAGSACDGALALSGVNGVPDITSGSCKAGCALAGRRMGVDVAISKPSPSARLLTFAEPGTDPMNWPLGVLTIERILFGGVGIMVRVPT